MLNTISWIMQFIGCSVSFKFRLNSFRTVVASPLATWMLRGVLRCICKRGRTSPLSAFALHTKPIQMPRLALFGTIRADTSPKHTIW
eukprot:3932466-Amphidinium_carterae.1